MRWVRSDVPLPFSDVPLPFCYLKRNAAARDVIEALNRSGHPALAYVEGLSPAARGRIESPTLRMAPRRIDVARAAAECGLAVLNGGHGVTCEMLLAGKPILFVPLNLEQQMTADAVTRMGAGESAAGGKEQPWQGASRLEAMLSEDRHTAAARRFADRYRPVDPARQPPAMFRRAEELLAEESLPGESSAVTREAELAAV